MKLQFNLANVCRLSYNTAMKIVTLMLLFCVYAVADAQVKVNEIRLKFGSEYHKAKEPDVIYPVVSTGNNKVDDKINFSIIHELTSDDSIKDISKALYFAMNDGLSELDYNITLNTKDILSLRLNAMGCGAYCESYFLYFNFNLKTGDRISINEVIDDVDSFAKIVLGDKLKAINADRKEKDSLLAANVIDTSTYKFVMDYVSEHCMKEVRIDKFLLYKTFLEIIDPCQFPHAVQALQPLYELKYSYKKIKRLLDPIFAEKIR